jgi:hypothetical protein
MQRVNLPGKSVFHSLTIPDIQTVVLARDLTALSGSLPKTTTDSKAPALKRATFGSQENSRAGGK